MKYVKYLLVGILFGITLTKSEVVSWYRIQEMFRFDAFHMYGVIGSAVALGIIITYLIKKFQVQSLEGETITFTPKAWSVPRYLIGGIIFGLGWAMTGACPGPLYILIGNGYLVIIVVVLSAMAGTFVYGLLRDKLPH